MIKDIFELISKWVKYTTVTRPGHNHCSMYLSWVLPYTLRVCCTSGSKFWVSQRRWDEARPVRSQKWWEVMVGCVTSGQTRSDTLWEKLREGKYICRTCAWGLGGVGQIRGMWGKSRLGRRLTDSKQGMPLKMGAHRAHQGSENMKCVCPDLIVQLLVDLCVQDNFHKLPDGKNWADELTVCCWAFSSKGKSQILYISTFCQRRVWRWYRFPLWLLWNFVWYQRIF